MSKLKQFSIGAAISIAYPLLAFLLLPLFFKLITPILPAAHGMESVSYLMLMGLPHTFSFLVSAAFAVWLINKYFQQYKTSICIAIAMPIVFISIPAGLDSAVTPNGDYQSIIYAKDILVFLLMPILFLFISDKLIKKEV